MNMKGNLLVGPGHQTGLVLLWKVVLFNLLQGGEGRNDLKARREMIPQSILQLFTPSTHLPAVLIHIVRVVTGHVGDFQDWILTTDLDRADRLCLSKLVSDGQTNRLLCGSVTKEPFPQRYDPVFDQKCPGSHSSIDWSQSNILSS